MSNAAGVRTHMVQVMFGFGIPSTKHSSETLVSGPARTFFSSSLRCTVGGTAKFKFQMYLSRELYNIITFRYCITDVEKVTDHWQPQRQAASCRCPFPWSEPDIRMSQHPLFSLFQWKVCYQATAECGFRLVGGTVSRYIWATQD